MSSCLPTDAEALGSRLRELREEMALTQELFAAQLGVTDRTLRNWEAGTRPVPSDVMQEMVRLGVDVVYLLLGSRADHLDVNDSLLKKVVAWVDGPWQEMRKQPMTDSERMRWILRFYLKALRLGPAAFENASAEREAKRRA